MKIDVQKNPECRSSERCIISLDFYELNTLCCRIMPLYRDHMKKYVEGLDGMFRECEEAKLGEAVAAMRELDKALDKMVE